MNKIGSWATDVDLLHATALLLETDICIFGLRWVGFSYVIILPNCTIV